MNEQISWVFELKVNDGAVNNLKELMKEMVEATFNNEPNTIAYHWSLDKDEKFCHVYECYKNGEAAVSHLETFKSKYAARMLSLGEATKFDVYGVITDDVYAALDGFGANYMSPIGGFVR